MKRRDFITAGMGGALLTLAACSSDDSSTTDTTETESGPVETEGSESGSSSSINVMIETAVESLDPQQATDGTSFEVIADYTDGLMQMDPDGQPIAAIAESYEVSDDGLTYTFKLREDAVWSNGEPVTAQDFIFSWQRAVDPAVASEYSFMLSDVAQIVNAAEIIAGEKDKSELGVVAEDDYTLVVNLLVPVSYFTSLMYFPTFYPINEAFFNEVGDLYGTAAEYVLSNGAFVLDSYEPAATAFSLSKNEDYYDAASISLPGLNYQLVQDSQQALMSYQNGDLDIIILSGDQVDQVKDDPEFRAVGAGYMWYVSPNISGVEALANYNIRMALTHAIDREAVAQDVVKDGSEATYTCVPIDFAAGPDGEPFAKDQTMFQDVCSYDAEAAADFWAAGLEELGVDSLTFDMVVDSDDAPQKVATVLKEQWETTLSGLTVNLTVEPKKQRVEDMQNGTFELGLTRWGPDYDDPMTYLGMWVTGNSNNYGEWSNDEYDSIIAECTTGDLATDVEGRWERLYDAEALVMNDAVIFPLYTQCNATMISSAVDGIDFHPVALNRVYKGATKA